MARGKTKNPTVEIINASKASMDRWETAYDKIAETGAVLSSGGGNVIAAAYAESAVLLGCGQCCDAAAVGQFKAGWPEYVKAHPGLNDTPLNSADGTLQRFVQNAYMGILVPHMEKSLESVLPELRKKHELDGKELHRHAVRQKVLKDFFNDVPNGTKRPTATKKLNALISANATAVAVAAAEKKNNAKNHAVGIAAKKLATAMHSLFAKTAQSDAVFLNDEKMAAIAKAQNILWGMAVEDDQIEEGDARKKRIHTDSHGKKYDDVVVEKVPWELGISEDDDDDDDDDAPPPPKKTSKKSASKTGKKSASKTKSEGVVIEDDVDEMTKFFAMYKQMKSSGNL